MGFISRQKARYVVYGVLRLNGHSRLEASWNILKMITLGKAWYYPRRLRNEMRAERLNRSPARQRARLPARLSDIRHHVIARNAKGKPS